MLALLATYAPFLDSHQQHTRQMISNIFHDRGNCLQPCDKKRNQRSTKMNSTKIDFRFKKLIHDWIYAKILILMLQLVFSCG